MPNRQQYRAALALESGPYVGTDQYDVRAMGGSNTSELHSRVYPIQSGIPQGDLYIDRPLHRPNATKPTHRTMTFRAHPHAGGWGAKTAFWIPS